MRGRPFFVDIGAMKRHLLLLLSFALAAAWRSGVRLPPLIVVGTGAGLPLVLLEGHARLTAYFLAAEAAPPEVVALVGWSPALPQWRFY